MIDNFGVLGRYGGCEIYLFLLNKENLIFIMVDIFNHNIQLVLEMILVIIAPTCFSTKD